MELRKRARVDYRKPDSRESRAQTKKIEEDAAAAAAAAAPSQTKRKKVTKPVAVPVPVKKKRPHRGVRKPAENRNASKSASEEQKRNVMEHLTLRRPAMKSALDLPQGCLQPVPEWELHRQNLNKSIHRQNQLFYAGLKEPKLMGMKHLENLKVPNDIHMLAKISQGLQEMIQIRESLERQKTLPPMQTAPEKGIRSQQLVQLLLRGVRFRGKIEEATSLVAQLHQIDTSYVRDVRLGNLPNAGTIDPNYINLNELKAIGKRIDRPLLKERNNNLNWPQRPKKKQKTTQNWNDMQTAQKFAKVSLYNIV
ncbi:uncharacterized protein KNAG_0A02010 [Huiozyma naganishii CBS 8797]|uniref:Uncharacterized protein n=1 Tax=Huiozyma naganishii (strain ATCC MYA-139 / BCRC 22969 / CBS 8797 / KCTC 17520 / NBRC 10181 / NCYC 3082 / Yp74L-3) TaxID=1071383 RepID=J7QZI7_HUIN7|nr:hypothetical protein KNAG_0A02010 [Kazachstania naganishii CBS 8797]CCK67890.1 hypothetical protein KNAG_0A02010 [Kazachstania naganishii CBS 8797]